MSILVMIIRLVIGGFGALFAEQVTQIRIGVIQKIARHGDML